MTYKSPPYKRLNTLSFTSKAIKIHGAKYDYSKTDYVRARNKVIIICKIHGGFSQRASAHLDGQGCPKCAFLSPKRYKKDLQHFIQKARKIHGDKYNYSLVEYSNSISKVNIICKIHGDFSQRASAHLDGQGCPKCAVDKNRAKTNAQFISEAIKIHGAKYDYSKTNYVGALSKIIIICPKHGEFTQIPAMHLMGNGCIHCGHERSVSSLFLGRDEFVSKATKIHGVKYDYSNVEYTHSKHPTTIICKKHGPFEQKPNYHLSGCGCQKCAGTHLQQSIYDFVSSYAKAEFNNRSVLHPLEIDIFVPSYKLGIEVNGLYWHSYNKPETKKERNKCLEKHNLCLKKGITLIQITEHEWHNQESIIKSIVLNKLNHSNSIHARKCSLCAPTKKEHFQFMDRNHVYGGKGCSYCMALKFGDDIVAMMSFSKHPRYQWEITRFANLIGYNVIGGASRLFKRFVNDAAPKTILTYADKRFSIGNVYQKLGFKPSGSTRPNYCYVKGYQIYSRQQYQKHKLKNKIDKFNPSLSESQNMFNNGFRRMWDAGNYRFIWTSI